MGDESVGVDVEVDGVGLMLARGQTLLQGLQLAGKRVETACGGAGSCHLCRVWITRGGEALSAPAPLERRALGNVLLAQGMRLSCQVVVEGPLGVKLPAYETSQQRRARIRRARERREKC